MLKTPNTSRRACSRMLPLFFLLAGAGLALGADGASGSSAPIFHWRPFLAPFHAVVLHFPIGFISMAFVLEACYFRRPSLEIRRISRLTIWLSLVTGIVSAVLGILRAAGGGYDPHLVEVHRLAGLAVPVFTVATLVMQKFSGPDRKTIFTHAYRSLLLATLGLLVLAGHYGGNLTHGSKYLVENAPQFVREFLEDDAPVPGTETSSAGSTAVASDEHGRFFQEKIKPILEAKCIRCHGAEKQKGGYRLDQPARALRGGESEKPAIVLGQPMSSHLVALILEKPGSDAIMPPDGKEPLTRDEIMALIEWIRDGASFGNVPPVKNAP